jgi:hypothetical protein
MKYERGKSVIGEREESGINLPFFSNYPIYAAIRTLGFLRAIDRSFNAAPEG